MKRVTNYEELLDIIQTVMGERYVSQTELAKGIDVTQPYMNRLFKQKNKPSIEVIFKICDYLEIQLACATPIPL